MKGRNKNEKEIDSMYDDNLFSYNREYNSRENGG